jgi:hypothetical protein
MATTRRRPRKTRQRFLLKDLIRQHGNIPMREALDALENALPGNKRWDVCALAELFLQVETLRRDHGISIKQACRTISQGTGYAVVTLETLYGKARALFDPIMKLYGEEILRGFSASKGVAIRRLT